ncbi:hypothetical protein LNP74_10595 [Klebsiella pneumoniae subsp. pneumoniae]|nr:hypothetical protein [Klebsiella pneumoniae subsp. pneumoniae]
MTQFETLRRGGNWCADESDVLHRRYRLPAGRRGGQHPSRQINKGSH